MLIFCVLLAGCPGSKPKPPSKPEPRLAPLPIQQAQAYEETVTGLFVSLADFEDASDGSKGHSQVEHFSITPATKRGACKFVVNITRTGGGALEANLGPGAGLTFSSPDIHDFTGYALLTMALYSEALRDDLRVTLVSQRGSWTSGRTLVTPGWNNVMIDIRRLSDLKHFSTESVRQVNIAFADAIGDVTFNIDDIMLIDNRRRIQPTPPGVKLLKNGLNYELTLPGGKKPIALSQSPDGLWRMPGRRCMVQISAKQDPLVPGKEDLSLMGRRRVGRVEIPEHNELRIRLVNTWYFPTRAGEWASLAIRRIRWSHTIYADGTWITNAELNNAGGKAIRQVGLFLDRKAAWRDAVMSSERIESNFAGPVARWTYMTPGPDADGKAAMEQYVNPGRIEIHMGRRDINPPGDANKDRFDESRGCYSLWANQAGHCRFTFRPPDRGRENAVFHVTGPWDKAVSVNAAGAAIRNVIRLDDGSVLFVLPGKTASPRRIEVVGKPRPPQIDSD